MVVKLNNGAVREIKKAEPIVEKRFTFNGDTLRMVAKANSSKEDITGILFKLKDGRDDDISVFAVNEDAVLVGNLQYSEVQRILDTLLTKGYVDISVYDYQPKTSIIADTVFDEGKSKPYCLDGFQATTNMVIPGIGNNFCLTTADVFNTMGRVCGPAADNNTEELIGGKPSHSGEYDEDMQDDLSDDEWKDF